MAQLNGIDVVCERTSLGRTAVYERIASGELRSVKVGRRRLVSDQAIDDFIALLESDTTDAA
ncbi:excisionase family DNA-binding protein [Rhodococcus sp. MEB064]|uniref:excisionase family DNA-binding protein n=1 Tax=Rhodococcus sp. MEB064 TaxID=1587522 RepID=UPI0005B71E99|nr:excisionase family DNA-binding protein [Rhodococcus sp. MEB064]KIQ19823.1 hypothetical protein RU01_03325 [Rhodococcus sp. MEB064]